MEDTKLLELAAKVCGRNLYHRVMPPEWVDRDVCMTWNPLINDGDALRLAVKLGFQIDIGRSHALLAQPFCEVRAYESRRSLSVVLARENGEALADATRRAIVRAAAQLAPK